MTHRKRATAPAPSPVAAPLTPAEWARREPLCNLPVPEEAMNVIRNALPPVAKRSEDKKSTAA